MSFTLLSAAILGIIALFVYGQARKGYQKGLTQSLINLSVIIACFFFAAWLASAIAKLFTPGIVKFVSELKFYEEFQLYIGDVSMVMGFVVQIVLALLLYIPVFFVLRGIFSLCIKIVIKKFISKANRNREQHLSENETFYVRNDKKIGALLGIVSGFVISVVVFMPFVGLLRSGNEIVDLSKEFIRLSKTKAPAELDLVDQYANDFSVALLDACGGNTIYNIVTGVSVDGTHTCINKEIKIVKNFDVDKLYSLTVAFKTPLNITDEAVALVEETLEELNQTVFLKYYAVQLIHNVADYWLEDKWYAGMKRPTFNDCEPLNEMMDEVLDILLRSTPEIYDENIISILTLINIFQENGELFNYRNLNAFMSELEDSDFIQELEYIFEDDSLMSIVEPLVDKIIGQKIADELYNDNKHSETIRTQLCNELADAFNKTQGLTYNSRLVAISSYTSKSFEEFGIYIPATINNRLMANLLDEISSSGGSVSGSRIEQFFANYLQGGDLWKLQ